MTDVIVVGAGLAGLCCARDLQREGFAVTVCEASDVVGGRVRTDLVEGFRLDRGFQVLLTAYPEALRVLDYTALDLRSFTSGALVRWDGEFMRLADPFRHPLQALGGVTGPPGTLADRLRVLRVRTRASTGSLAAMFARGERTTAAYLREAGFSDAMIRGFLRPFLSGIFLEADLQTSSRFFEFVFRMFAEGETTVPARGMGEIPRQLASELRPGTVRLQAAVRDARPRGVTLQSGEAIDARAVVIATDGAAAAALAGLPAGPWRSVTCVYYAAPEPPVHEPTLVLNGVEKGPVNNCAVMSEVSRDYAPAQQALVSVSVLGTPGTDEDLDRAVRRQLRAWWGPVVDTWRTLRTYRITHALPARPGHALSPVSLDVQLPSGVFVCGDHRDTPSIQGAMFSGRRAASAVASALRR